MVKKYMTADTMIFLVMFVIGIAIDIGTFTTIQIGAAQRFPYFVGTGMIILSGALLIFEISKTRKQLKESIADEKEKKAAVFPWYKTLIFCAAVTILVWLFGYIVAVWLACFFGCFILAKQRSKLKMILYPSILTGVIYLIFVYVFYVRLPKGLIFSLLGL